MFDPGQVLHPRVDRSAMVTVRMAKYSVPARLIGRRVRVSLRASELVVFDGRTVVASHARVVTKGGDSIVLVHYLEVLKSKPGALPGSTALARARASGTFTAAHDAFWAAARKVIGDAEGTRPIGGPVRLAVGYSRPLGIGARSTARQPSGSSLKKSPPSCSNMALRSNGPTNRPCDVEDGGRHEAKVARVDRMGHALLADVAQPRYLLVRRLIGEPQRHPHLPRTGPSPELSSASLIPRSYSRVAAASASYAQIGAPWANSQRLPARVASVR